ncbi:MAG: sulfite exporter TauE/SafE family protein [Anaerolineae bacterium]|jgi:hypothetical protein|nr:sulfite exporter TauE/SafE family protein [Anaerolineae bacterium]
MSMDTVAIALIVYFAILTQAIAGSGLALISMPLLVQFMDPLTAAAVVALMALTTQLVMLTRYRQAVNMGHIWRLMLASVAGIPLGVLALASLDKRLILTLLGVLLIGYALYSLLGPRLPEIKNPRWSYPFGFASGLLGGAYNTGGPPFVIYGMCRRWPATEYKGNLQVLLMVNSFSVVVAHLAAGHYTAGVLQQYLITLPMIALGTLSGFWLDRYINEALFKKIVLVVLLFIGIKMLLP